MNIFQNQYSIKKEHVTIVLLVTISLVIHSIFIIDGFGENDAGRLPVAALRWHTSNGYMNSYLYRVSPLYLCMLKTAMNLNMPLEYISNFMNWTSVIFGSLCLIPLFYLYKKLTCFEVAMAGCLLYSFTPTFWLANIYGMPLIIAFFFFLLSLSFFEHGLSKQGGSFYGLMTGAIISASLAITFKADIVLCYGVFFGLVLYCKSVTLRNVLFSFSIPLIALAFLFFLGHILFPDMDAMPIRKWDNIFPFTTKVFSNFQNQHILPRSIGKWMFVGIITACAICVVWKKYRRQLILFLLGSIPSFLFWGLRLGHITRHVTVGCAFSIFMLAFVMYELTNKYRFWPLFFIVLIALNYFSNSSNDSTAIPSSRIFESKSLIQKRIDSFHRSGKEFSRLSHPSKMAVGDNGMPYIKWETLSAASKFELIKFKRGPEFTVTTKEGDVQKVGFWYITYRPVHGPVKGWHLWTWLDYSRVRNK